ncbi:MAG: hypothetical protein V3V99_07965 [candidate division Zixibacteria bacterium]
MRRVLLLLLLCSSFVMAQDKDKPDKWEPLRFFVGQWHGQVSGMPGNGTGEREYKFILGDNYLHCVNKAVFKPQDKNPKGEVHEDWMFFSFDAGRKKHVMRQFNIEGFTNQFVIDSVSFDGKTIVMTTEYVENGPPGTKARYILMITGDDEFTEIFELAFSGKELKECLKNNWTRKK